MINMISSAAHQPHKTETQLLSRHKEVQVVLFEMISEVSTAVKQEAMPPARASHTNAARTDHSLCILHVW